MLFLLASALCPLLSFAMPSSHPHSLHDRAPNRPRIMTYYADWAPPKSIDYSLFDVIIFAFALPDEVFQLRWDTDQAPALLQEIVPLAHADSAKVMLSVGGWTGSRYFSDALSTAQNREIFVDNIHNVYNRFNLDGIDIDWEYPGRSGQPGNSERPTDSANMLQFFKLLQQKLHPGAMISAAVQDSTFIGPEGYPMKDVSAFSQFVDWVTLMNYDTFETRSPPGPNAPLSDACGNSSQPTQNAVEAYKAWTSAGFPPSKLVLGVPGYGYIVDSDAKRLSSRSNFRAYSEDGSGQIQFQSLISQGILVQNPDGSFTGSGGFIREWDNCSATPFLYSSGAAQVIPYDDADSLGIKAAWARKMKLGGVNLFDAHGDTPQHHLAQALRANLFPSTFSAASYVPSSSAVVMSVDATSTSPTTVSSTISSSPSVYPTSTSVTLPGGIELFSPRT